MKSKSFARVAFIVVLILLIPLIAMQFTGEVDWDHADFIVAGILLFGTGLILEFLASKVSSKTCRYIGMFVIVIALLLIWAELAVGVFGTPFAGS